MLDNEYKLCFVCYKEYNNHYVFFPSNICVQLPTYFNKLLNLQVFYMMTYLIVINKTKYIIFYLLF